ncbi:MAG: F0F1 ATP synthase subunit A, partial [Elusimicrobiota bacterium]
MDLLELIGHHIMDHPLASGELFGFHWVFTKHMMMISIVSIILMSLIPWAAKQASRVPKGLYNLVEMYVLFVRDKIVAPSLGHHTDRYLGYFLTLFLFILLSNLLGLIPTSATATSNIAVTGGLALCTLILINFASIREHGFLGHLKSFVPSGFPQVSAPLV